MSRITYIYIVHGYQAGPNKHWFPWLIEELSTQKTVVKSLSLPTPDTPDYQAWVEAIEQQIHGLDEDTYFIGHSLGTITLLKYLNERMGDRTLGGLILVAPFDQSLPTLPELDSFIHHEIHYQVLIDRIQHRYVLASEDDACVPYTYSQAVAQALRADFQGFINHGHFCQCDGILRLPEVADYLIKVS